MKKFSDMKKTCANLQSNRDNLAQGIGSAASALVDVWQAFAGPVAQRPTESHKPQTTNKK